MKFTLPLGILILLLVVLAGRAYYTVDETEQVVITQFGAPVGETITEAGLHFKWPWRKANYLREEHPGVGRRPQPDPDP